MNLLENLGIEIEYASQQKTLASILVTDRLKDLSGFLHDGFTSILAETAASISANCPAKKGQIAVGVSVNTNHFMTVKNGLLKAFAEPIAISDTTQLWKVEIFQYPGRKIISTSDVTTILKNK
ncbi:aromatic compound catabolic protein [Oenococcus oeni]|nr:aromatic compound catabolic protein [Oenococcus oeni X2L]KMQ38976.1 aromatic compound catabolic protein [Oenococcus oeni]OIK62746.1 aromatic compound catabolic protein [Oenococcus oeni]OIK63655.1 aromatic compound catabolic protein [Oenococcus oeni]OIK82424.1 aromatic compound catabolic protein [Oenococcus oeni]